MTLLKQTSLSILLLLLLPNTLSAQSDNCTTAPSLVVSTDCLQTAGNTQGLTAFSTQNTCGGNTDDDGWFKFTAISTSTRISVFSDQLTDLAIAVFTNCQTEIACANEGGIGRQEKLEIETVPDRAYFIQIYEANIGSGAFLICVSTATTLPTNECNLLVDAGRNVVICEETEVQLDGTVVGASDTTIYEWLGTPESISYIKDLTIPDPVVVLPINFEGSLVYTLKVREDTCQQIDSLRITKSCQTEVVLPEEVDTLSVDLTGKTDIYIPSAFSPNGDGQNDWFFPFGAAGVTGIKAFRIYDRWGNLVFERRDIAPNVPTEGWDGTFNNQLLFSGVYVYMVEYELWDSSVRLKIGEILLSQ